VKIAVLMGGISDERPVSLASGTQVAKALREAGHEVIGVDTGQGILDRSEEEAILESGVGDPDPEQVKGDMLSTGDLRTLTQDPRLAGLDAVFLALHGGRGEDGTIQSLLGLAGLPFVGSDRVGCALAMDKDLTKRLLRDEGIPTPDWITIEGEEAWEERLPEIVQRLGLPLIVKPPSGGSTLGLTLVREEERLPAAVALSLSFQKQVMFEAYVRGRELTVGILGRRALPVGEIIPDHELFDYECKYRPGLAQEIFPADLPRDVAEGVQKDALEVHRILRLRDFSRVDFILDSRGTPWCLEANALPGFTGNSLLPKAARASGIPFPELCHQLAEMAFLRARE
jgi:D-alanine-D-alanine ligase